MKDRRKCQKAIGVGQYRRNEEKRTRRATEENLRIEFEEMTAPER